MDMDVSLDKQWRGPTPPQISKRDKNIELGSVIRETEGVLFLRGLLEQGQRKGDVFFFICHYYSQ